MLTEKKKNTSTPTPSTLKKAKKKKKSKKTPKTFGLCPFKKVIALENPHMFTPYQGQ